MSTISALKHIVRRLIEHKIDIKDLETILDNPMPLVVDSLTLQDFQKILSLTMVVDNEFDFIAPVPIPPDLKIWLEKFDRAHGTSRDEALIRCKLNLLLMERIWAYSPVKWKGKTWVLSGRPDYGIWYGEEEDIDLNVVIMEAKKLASDTVGIPQALAYMGCVHKQRKELGKADTTVYGISTDTITFTFMKLDNESRWSFKMVGVVGNGFEQVLGLLVYLMEKAASISPAASEHTSRRTQEESWESDLIFDYDPEMDVETDVETDEWFGPAFVL
ncbi:hypothetical protein CBS147333_9538 [Penicillium roqueforti]|nr:hypothetical protein CBS147354_857 [Penicillium roqueforti]KAI3096690.1 hypothetical protein CBS147333_9538 [Penicillium roqueforti]KAI3211344.1 hypothetical protein CBS147311_980 [Penicillium roqueforti]KAI3274733.1 hypothetical protein CBS147308_2333 [Penicillium roqueforti]KAI3294057.1 hypothetical protein DTO003C3_2901 [Penicillium roqueforti]